MQQQSPTPFKISVDKHKKAGVVYSWGTAPYFYEKRGGIISNGFIMRSTFLGHVLVSETLVVENANGEKEALFRFQVENNHSVLLACGEFFATPSGALDVLNKTLEANGHAFLKSYREGTNGSLHIGIRCPEAQAEIRKAAGEPDFGAAVLPVLTVSAAEKKELNPKKQHSLSELEEEFELILQLNPLEYLLDNLDKFL